MKITWFGTASILLESEGEKLLFDPFVQLAGGSNPNSLEDFPADTDICITHGHVDHLFSCRIFWRSRILPYMEQKRLWILWKAGWKRPVLLCRRSQAAAGAEEI